MSILKQIIANKKKEVKIQKGLRPLKLLEQSIFFNTEVVSMKYYLERTDKEGVIAEIKRSSPSTGLLKNTVDIEKLSIAYMQAGATALSVLTDQHYFNGCKQDLITARKFNYCPILRKDFTIDKYQIAEAKSIGADCILLIAACLTPKKTNELASYAKSIGLEVLLEVHTKTEINTHLNQHLDLIGVNNRNLNDFTTNIQNSIELASHIPGEFVKISESGLYEASQLIKLRKYGYQGFLIGGHFMKKSNPAEACKALIVELQKQKP